MTVEPVEPVAPPGRLDGQERLDGLERLGRAELAILVREYLLAGHLIDRAGMPQVVGPYGIDAMREIAIDEWMGASPIYTRRMQRALGFGGDDVATIFKGMQLDVGAPPEFMDFRYEVASPSHGEFRLASCGALLDVEPMGDEFVVAMCHHIEDPTFDATAWATNPRARMSPIHRPPRTPADRHPHCHWVVDIDPASEPLPEPAPATRMAATLAATLDLGPAATPENGPGTGTGTDESSPDPSDGGPTDGGMTDGGPTDGGMTDYAGPLNPDVRLEDFSRAALVRIADEVCLQGHLLALSFSAAVADRFGPEAAVEVGRKQFIGIAGLTADRLRRAFELGSSMADLATVIELHPAFRPRAYVDVQIALADERADGGGAPAGGGSSLTVTLGPCPARDETVGRSWLSLLGDELPGDQGSGEDVSGEGARSDGVGDALAAIAHAVDPRALVRRIPAGQRSEPAGAVTWMIELGDEPAPERAEVLLTRFSTGADFRFSDPPVC